MLVEFLFLTRRSTRTLSWYSISTVSTLIVGSIDIFCRRYQFCNICIIRYLQLRECSIEEKVVQFKVCLVELILQTCLYRLDGCLPCSLLVSFCVSFLEGFDFFEKLVVFVVRIVILVSLLTLALLFLFLLLAFSFLLTLLYLVRDILVQVAVDTLQTVC